MRHESDAGLSLVEVMAAFFVLSLLALASASTLSQALGLTHTNENRVVAANVATRAIESARVVDPVKLQEWSQVPPPADSVVTVPVGPTTYTVRHLVQPVEAPSATSPCKGSIGHLRAYRIQVEVTWPEQRGVEPVRSETIRALEIGELPETSGTLAVSVKDRNGGPVTNQRLDLTSPASTGTVQTDSQGCGVFTALAPRTDYSVTTPASNGSPVSRQGALAASRSPITVRAGAITHQELFYDTATEIRATITGPSGYPPPTTLGVTVANPQLTSGTRAFRDCGLPNPTDPCISGSPKRLLRLYPFLDGYQVWAGTCSDDRPADPLLVKPVPGTVAEVSPRTAPVKVTNLVNDWTVWATNSCGNRHTLGTSSGGTGSTASASVQSSLPAGRWTVSACNNPCSNTKTASPVHLVIPWSGVVEVKMP